MASSEVGPHGGYINRALRLFFVCMSEYSGRGSWSWRRSMLQLELELEIAQEDRWMAPSIWNWVLIERG